MQLGIGVFGSGPLREGELLHDGRLAAAVDGLEQLANVQARAALRLQDMLLIVLQCYCPKRFRLVWLAVLL
jgi:hypothetical protein